MHFEEGEERSRLMFADRSRLSSIFACFSLGALFSSLKSTVRRLRPRLIMFVGVVAPSPSATGASFCLGVRNASIVELLRSPLVGVFFSADLTGVRTPARVPRTLLGGETNRRGSSDF